MLTSRHNGSVQRFFDYASDRLLKETMLNNITAVRDLFQKKGLKLTHQRLEILREISRSKEHPSAEEVYRLIVSRAPTISLDTVYRALTCFERMGLISRVEVLDDQIRYDPDTEPHHHFVCVRCKRIEDFHWPDFDGMQAPSRLTSLGRTFSRHAEFRGVCTQCLHRQRAKHGGARKGGEK
jgi:Fur family peroxide stress response transcriptional regulator